MKIYNLILFNDIQNGVGLEICFERNKNINLVLYLFCMLNKYLFSKLSK